MKKQVETFINEDDERLFSDLLIEQCPNVVFLDGSRWQDEPLVKKRLDLCSSNNVYLWNKDICHELPTLRRADKQLQGPVSGVVVQCMRCRVDSDCLLLSGRFAVGFEEDDVSMANFFSIVLKTLRSISENAVKIFDIEAGHATEKTVKAYYLGDRAKAWIGAAPNRLLKARNVQLWFVPIKNHMDKNNAAQQN